MSNGSRQGDTIEATRGRSLLGPGRFSEAVSQGRAKRLPKGEFAPAGEGRAGGDATGRS